MTEDTQLVAVCTTKTDLRVMLALRDSNVYHLGGAPTGSSRKTLSCENHNGNQTSSELRKLNTRAQGALLQSQNIFDLVRKGGAFTLQREIKEPLLPNIIPDPEGHGLGSRSASQGYRPG